jgi:hypothetical protein
MHEQLCQEIQNQDNHINIRNRQKTLLPTADVPVLLLNGTRLSGDYTVALRECIHKSEIQTYYRQKYGWSITTMSTVDWHAHGKAINQLSQRQQKTITQLIHNWLPTNADHSQQRLGTGRLCSYCRSCEETQIHYFQCPHPHATSNWDEAAKRIKTKLRKYNKNVDHRLINLITTSISQWRTTPHPDIPITLPPQYHQLFQAQSNIGWNQIITGRFAIEWQLTLDTQGTPSSTWVTYCIRIVLQEMYEVWKLRCDQEHGKSQEDTRQRALNRLTPQVERLFEKQHDIDQTDAHIFNKSKEDVLCAPTAIIENWIFKTSLRVRDSIKRRRKKEKTHNVTYSPILHSSTP